MPSNCYIKQNAIKQSISTAFKHWPAPPAVGLQKKKKNVPKERNKIEKNLFTFILKNDYQYKDGKIVKRFVIGEILE